MEILLNQEIQHLRVRLRELIAENKRLKLASQKQADIQEKMDNESSAKKQQCSLQKLLHGYAGVLVVVKEETVEVIFKPSCKEMLQREFFIILGRTNNFWKILGSNLPISIVGIQNKKLFSLEELGQCIRSIRHQIHAYFDRKRQVEFTEELCENHPGPSIWYSLSYQRIFITLPLPQPQNTETGQEKKCEVMLQYGVQDIFPSEVSVRAEDLDERKLQVLEKRLTHFFKLYKLQDIIQDITGEKHNSLNREAPDVENYSILSNLDPSP